MQKILNDPESFVDEMLDGILAAHPGQLRRPAPRAIVRADARPRRPADAAATMAAKVGRAGWLSDRAAGHEDAGARLVALAFAAASTEGGTAEGR